MTIFNVQTRVIHLVEADSPDEAWEKLNESLRRAGFLPEYAQQQERDVFESDEQDVEPDNLP